ncbi:hypothetical protein Acy02nite_31130 [Actinoplanes cyaneus]|uniref:Uncharacterized protein n=1 Tax=Actinoplanes cyaneus TaxID=52696 RepID=A0A919IH31_9ACTN|nr:hypothetical protein [Actinoplanes cyaneus]MCW2142424.1 hypothetical protein [Actinoplanes cyaneus]GID65232.1 hypothetical protein Acy02nite_31130 [Actinoplanes cyaneus]
MRRLLTLTLVATGLLAPAPAVAAPPAAPAVVSAGSSPREDLSGQRLRSPGSASIYLVDPEGYARAFPDIATYTRFYEDTDGVEVNDDLDDISRGPAFSRDAYLLRVVGEDGIYVVSDGVRRGIASWRVLERYGFDPDRARPVTRDRADEIPEGPAWR